LKITTALRHIEVTFQNQFAHLCAPQAMIGKHTTAQGTSGFFVSPMLPLLSPTNANIYIIIKLCWKPIDQNLTSSLFSIGCHVLVDNFLIKA
jgi:hypothetical protein